ncbi:uncharacterized protein RCO7_14479 [Rhynchosporium graminicola]|uniref:Uncharacterized protein n=1 Tax=Rhynchosporium graminicola TaxID=2792576 RepID=A0A1E1KJQ0_9HELO|nr:uncharacterized protein RCO7_14479 [Rhynchosporium commune]
MVRGIHVRTATKKCVQFQLNYANFLPHLIAPYVAGESTCHSIVITSMVTFSDTPKALLRKLEYGQATKFLTTTASEIVNPATASRLHIHLRVAALTFDSCVQICTSFFRRMNST